MKKLLLFSNKLGYFTSQLLPIEGLAGIKGEERIMADFYICNESHVVIYNSPTNRESVRVGVQWGYINRQGRIPEFSYCCCGVADSDNMTVHGPSVACRPSVRREVEGAVLQFLNQSRLAVRTLVREYHNFTLTDLEKQFIKI